MTALAHDDDCAAARARMVDAQLRERDIADPRVLDAMGRVPRHLFVPEDLRDQAYDDGPLPIGAGQTISQPYMVARMLELLELGGAERVLEVGCGSGYVAALLALLASEVFAVDIVRSLCDLARSRLEALGLANARIEWRDGTQGWLEHAPFDAIVVSAGAPRVPALLLDQLVDGGRLVAPVGERARQVLVRVIRRGGEYDVEEDVPCRFVDLLGRYGWDGEGAPRA